MSPKGWKRSKEAANGPDKAESSGEEPKRAKKGGMENLWKEAFPVGTEWDQYDHVYEIDWDFSNLEDAFEEGGILHGKRVYMFGCTEPQLVHFKDTSKVVHIPAVVAVTSPFPPSDKVGIKSVQMEGEMIVPMKEMKMGWVPYIPEDARNSVERYKCNIFTLKCTQRRAALKQLKQERIKKYEYCLPYLYQPLKEEEQQPDTVVPVMYPLDDEKPPVVTEFDWAFDDVEEFTDNLIQDEALPAEEKQKFKVDYIKDAVAAERKKQREVREARRKAIKEMSEATKVGLENMRFFKFYPVQNPETPDLASLNLKASFINRYYGKAHEVF
ncbi:hypothetical protein O6H91_23G008800 [Diphasiastrum complanatum]|uniref:Uncharacterized protein n=1 Tax=Diphasiastrum complanatum TaxID=34168 RepID=A0ACC2A8B6_DIPCM|nr:hypothetical protein O6H91_23G008800 [Diphasiastrum complanatum]